MTDGIDGLAEGGTMGSGDSISGTGEPAETAHKTGSPSWLNVAVSGAALVASTVSLWESTLKQPDLKVYVTDNIYYTRDPYGSFEVVAVPVTIQNSGARDDAVIALQLDVTTAAGTTERFVSTYTADAQYFGSSDDVTNRKRRPKQPFAPLSVSGRGAYTGTILFYTSEYKEQRFLEPKTKVELALRVVTPGPNGFFDRMLQKAPNVITLHAEVPNYLQGALYAGDTVRLKITGAAGQ
jgi:hypothetical protein